MLREASRREGGDVGMGARYELGLALYQAGDTEGSVKVLQVAVRDRPEEAQLRFALGAALTRWARYDGAIRELSEAASLEPDRADIKVQLAKALRHRGELPRAMALLDEAVRLEPTMVQGRHQLAMAYARAATDSVPPPEGRWLLGLHPASLSTRLRRREAMLAEAQRQWDHALLADGHFFPALFSLGTLHHQVHNDTRLALRFFQRAFLLEPKNVFLNLYHKVAHAQEMRKAEAQWREAKAHAQKAWQEKNADRLAAHTARVMESMSGLDIWRL